LATEARDLRVAAVQMESANGDIAANLERATGFAEEAAGGGARLVVFPEFMPSGYIFTNAAWDAAEPTDGPTMAWLSATSAGLGIWLGTSFLEAVGDEFFNTFVVTDPEGNKAGQVRKQTPAAVEACFFKGEPGGHVIETGIGKIGVGICYENQLAYMPRLMYAHSVDIMLMPHSAPAPTPTPLLPSRMLDTYAEVLRTLPSYYAQLLGVPVLYINKVGLFRSPVPGLPFYSQDSHFPGESTIADPDGKVLARLGSEEGIAIADVRLDPARKSKVPPACRGRWALEVPWQVNGFIIAETAGRVRYSLSPERKRRAKEISS